MWMIDVLFSAWMLLKCAVTLDTLQRMGQRGGVIQEAQATESTGSLFLPALRLLWYPSLPRGECQKDSEVWLNTVGMSLLNRMVIIQDKGISLHLNETISGHHTKLSMRMCDPALEWGPVQVHSNFTPQSLGWAPASMWPFSGHSRYRRWMMWSQRLFCVPSLKMRTIDQQQNRGKWTLLLTLICESEDVFRRHNWFA